MVQRWRSWLIFLLLFVTGCVPASCRRNESAPVPQALKETTISKEEELRLQELAKQEEKTYQRLRALVQALAIERAAWKVVLDRPEAEILSMFYPVVRALGKSQAKVPVPRGKNLCDQFETRTVGDETQVLMTCRKGGSPFVSFKEKDQSMSVRFISRELADVIGLGASLASKDATCELTWKTTAIEHMACHQLYRDKGAQQVAVIEDLVYQAESPEIMKLSGQVLKDLIPVSKFSTTVPLTGVINVTETWLPPPPTVEQIEAEVTKEEKKNKVYEEDENATNSGANPDQLTKEHKENDGEQKQGTPGPIEENANEPNPDDRGSKR